MQFTLCYEKYQNITENLIDHPGSPNLPGLLATHFLDQYFKCPKWATVWTNIREGNSSPNLSKNMINDAEKKIKNLIRFYRKLPIFCVVIEWLDNMA